jgi:hypothetical protein
LGFELFNPGLEATRFDPTHADFESERGSNSPKLASMKETNLMLLIPRSLLGEIHWILVLSPTIQNLKPKTQNGPYSLNAVMMYTGL